MNRYHKDAKFPALINTGLTLKVVHNQEEADEVWKEIKEYYKDKIKAPDAATSEAEI